VVSADINAAMACVESTVPADVAPAVVRVYAA
jgi:hypothetical protein